MWCVNPKLVCVLSSVALAFLSPRLLWAQALDPHTIYETHCSKCHDPHAGEFAYRSLERVGGEVRGKSTNSSLLEMLQTGHGKLEKDQVDALAVHFQRILASGQIFRKKCLGCHERAVVLARMKLVIKNDKLTGRFSDRDIASFLRNHGRLEGIEVDRMVEVLRRQLN